MTLCKTSGHCYIVFVYCIAYDVVWSPVTSSTKLDGLRWLNTVSRAVSGNSRDGECFNLHKQTWR